MKLAPRDGYKTRKITGFYRTRTNQIKKYPLNCPQLSVGFEWPEREVYCDAPARQRASIKFFQIGSGDVAEMAKKRPAICGDLDSAGRQYPQRYPGKTESFGSQTSIGNGANHAGRRA